MSQSLARKLLLFANQIIRRRVSFDIIICFSVTAFWGFPALRCTFLLDSCSEVSRHFHLARDRSSRKWNSTYLRAIQTAFWLATKIHLRLDFANANYWDMKNRLQIDWLALTSKCSFRAIELKIRFPILRDRHYFRHWWCERNGIYVIRLSSQSHHFTEWHNLRQETLRNTGTCVTVRKRRMSWEDNHGTSLERREEKKSNLKLKFFNLFLSQT